MVRLAALALVTLALTGCEWAHQVMEPAAAPNVGWDPQESYLKYEKKIPLDAVWWDAKTDFSKYKKVYVAPVNTDHVLKMDFWQKLSMGAKDFLNKHNEIPYLARVIREVDSRRDKAAPSRGLASGAPTMVKVSASKLPSLMVTLDPT